MTLGFLLSLEDWMLPCLNKKFLGVECMGCGLQRSMAHLLRGEFGQAFDVYPAIYPLLLLFLTIGFTQWKPWKYANKAIILLVIATVGLMLYNFIPKLIN